MEPRALIRLQEHRSVHVGQRKIRRTHASGVGDALFELHIGRDGHRKCGDRERKEREKEEGQVLHRDCCVVRLNGCNTRKRESTGVDSQRAGKDTKTESLGCPCPGI